MLRHAQPCAPAAIEVLGEPEDYLSRRFGRARCPARARRCPSRHRRDGRANVHQRREILDRRGESPLAVLADARRDRLSPLLAICADVPRRIAGLQPRIGGFALASYAALEHDPALAGAFRHIVALDPPVECSGRPVAATRAAASPTWHGARLSYALLSRYTSWSTVSALRSSALYRGLRRQGG